MQAFLQKLVNEGQEKGEEDSHDPETEGHDREGRIILVGDDGSNLGNGRVLLFFEDDGRALGIELLVNELLFSNVFLLVFGHGERGRIRRRCAMEGEERGGGGEDGWP